MKKLDLSFVKENTIDNIIQGKILSSPIHGYGLFAKVDIDAGDILCVLDGQVVSWSKYIEIQKNISSSIVEPFLQYFFMEWNALDEETLLVRTLRTKYSYINHSRSPNTKIYRHPLRIIAIKNVEIDSEITLDYREEPLSSEYIKKIGSSYL